MKIFNSKLIKLYAKIILLLLFCLYLWYTLDLTDIRQLVYNVNLVYLFLATVLYSINYFLRALRYRMMFANIIEIEWPIALKVSLLHAFYNRILPARTGEVSYIVMINKEKGVSIPTASVSLLLFRIYDILICSILFLLCIISSSLHNNKWLLSLAIAAVILLLMLLVLLPIILSKIQRMPIKGKWRKKIIGFADTETWLTFFKFKRTVKLIFISLAIWVSIYWMFIQLLIGFNVPLNIVESFFAITIAVITNLLPISGIGGFGSMELGWTFGFTHLGLDYKLAMSTGVLSNLFTFLATILFGFIGFGMQSVTRLRKRRD